jgi:hypothetical protein
MSSNEVNRNIGFTFLLWLAGESSASLGPVAGSPYHSAQKKKCANAPALDISTLPPRRE